MCQNNLENIGELLWGGGGGLLGGGVVVGGCCGDQEKKSAHSVDVVLYTVFYCI